MNREDFVAVLRHSWNGRMWAQCAAIAMPLAGMLALLGYSSAYANPRTADQAAASGWIGAASGIGVVLLTLVWFRWLYLRQNEQLPGRMGLHTLEITPSGFRMGTSVGESSSNWSTVSRIIATPAHLVIGIKLGRGEIIPRSAFPSPSAADAFLDAARRWHAEYCGSNGPR